MSETQEFLKDHEQFIATHRCKKCGSNKITRSLMGRPYMPYVDFHKDLSSQLGWQTLTLSGCTHNGSDFCS